MMIKHINLHVIEMPLKQPFITHLEKVSKRRGIIVEVVDETGLKGYGEAVAFTTPWYTEETVQTCFHMLKDVLVPQLLKEMITSPRAFHKRFHPIRRNHMAKAALDMALCDLEAKKQDIPLWQWLGGVNQQVPAGVVVAADSAEAAIIQIHQYVDQGYERVKIKVSPERDIDLLKRIRAKFPDLDIMADANSAYTLEDIDKLVALGQFNLLMIEQPLGVDDIVDHAELQQKVETPICLDESIVTFHDAESAIKLGACQVMNLKIGRVGGLLPAKQIHDLCLHNGIKVWCGGMIEFGISRAHNLALSTLEGFSMPGDLSSSSRFWEEDIITPAIEVVNGKVTAPMKPGIGFDINEKRLEEVTVLKEKLNRI
ncbi:o-succinylbenzoate synthase [Falsibacillus albus]|uniref:o-succinylbenzoate synthase n=1 Tax=Falsibacillus albus TaxID=2478915 RepID=A0A3L7K463_9BACI|nr:o-succinylbenzoate synthase [Falsibacillus albus]RLQ97843.1 o-succinylbenzoate synthase [Falsibacillus albus]